MCCGNWLYWTASRRYCNAFGTGKQVIVILNFNVLDECLAKVLLNRLNRSKFLHAIGQLRNHNRNLNIFLSWDPISEEGRALCLHGYHLYYPRIDSVSTRDMVHPLLKLLRSSKPAFGMWLALPSVHTARQVALAGRAAGLSWVCIDCEHGLTSLVPGVAETISAITSLPPSSTDVAGVQNPTVLVRIPAPGFQYSGPVTSHQIKQVLDAGAHGIVVPMVGNAEIARQIALDARFPPVGRRGFGSPFTHQTRGVSMMEYLKTTANDEVIVCVQIESRDAVDNLEDIAQTPGIDVLFIGPFDLSLALGYPTPNPEPHPEVEKVIQKIKETAHKYHKKVAFYCTSGDRGKKRADDGFDIVNVTSDVGSITDGVLSNLRAAAGDDFISETSRKEGY